MQVEEWEEIKRIFESALNFNGGERARFLGAACHDRPGLRQTVGELLRAHEEAVGVGVLDDDPSCTLPQVFEPGQLVAERFRIIRLISRGGMGEVYETFDERLSVRLALKTLRPEFAADRDALERFRREIRVTRDFAHPNLCRVYELIEHRPTEDREHRQADVITCLSMQLMSGETLQQHLKKTGQLSPAVALPLIRQIAGAVAVLHENGIIHRDLKPSNIMITPGSGGEPRAIVMDFGLTKPFQADGDLFESRSDFQAGAPFYLAPELLRGEKPSIASDIYALGLVIDEMVTGGGAYAGETVEAVLYQKLWNEPKDPATRKPDLPTEWCQVIRRCLHRDPTKRFAGVDEIITDLSPGRMFHTRPLPLLYRAQRALGPPVSKVRGKFSNLRMSRVILGSLVAAGACLGYIGSRPIKTSVLIFEFENLTSQAKNEYLSRGTTWEVERLLYDIPGVSVSSFHAPRSKGGPLKPNERFSIDGYVEADNSITRLLVKVTENSSGRIVWMNKYDTTAINSLKMQSDIAAGAVEAMRDAVLVPKETKTLGFLPGPEGLVLWLHKWPLFRQGPGAPPTESQEAMEAYSRGRALWEERSVSSEREAVQQYEKALELDSNFALAEADLAGVYLGLQQFNAAPRVSLLQAAREHAERAVSKGPQYPQSYTSLAAVQQASWDWIGAEQSYRKAIAMSPKFARAHRWFGGLLIQFGRFDEGLKETRLAIDLDPYDYSTKFALGTYLVYAGRVQEDIPFLEQALQKKNSAWGHQNLFYAYARLGQITTGDEQRLAFDRALQEAQTVATFEGRELKPDELGMNTPMYALIYALRGDTEKARAQISRLLQAAQSGALEPMDLAYAYVALGDLQAALNVLKQAVRVKDPGMLYIKVDPFLDPLRKTPEFQALVAQTGL